VGVQIALLHTEFQLPMLLRGGSFMVGDKKQLQRQQTESMKLIVALLLVQLLGSEAQVTRNWRPVSASKDVISFFHMTSTAKQS
jgi:hypothetical protein